MGETEAAGKTLWCELWEAGFTVGLVGGKLKVRPRSWSEPLPVLTQSQTQAITAHIRELAALCREREQEDTAVSRFLNTPTGSRWLGQLFTTPFNDAGTDLVHVELGQPGKPPAVSVVVRQDQWEDIRRRIAQHNADIDRMRAQQVSDQAERQARKATERGARRRKHGPAAEQFLRAVFRATRSP